MYNVNTNTKFYLSGKRRTELEEAEESQENRSERK